MRKNNFHAAYTWYKSLNKGKAPELKKELEEGHHTGLSIRGFYSAGPGRGAILQTIVGERIHLNPGTIQQMLDVCK